ncbi:FkbM family methyltransferase [Siccirubricoccus sp. KC 17139]|uniref:FkbM family methyltransferase n=1 Tax=Siccirubricoccus soli TaxID=2899147 RepID=A0ABT1D949_9PROT|nr:FkbM family methyltransferase [Siccirubricoccus soli]MCO6418466.1 FkbM family methyltransferase [Siccirubricoccus soli]MCP2684601.1 FkbM family methyltransferase [Siccirubricoccus soli]
MNDDIPRLFALQERHNVFEDIIAGLYGAVLQPGDLAVDGGANRGLHSFPMAESVGPAGQVIAFEPIPWLAETLRIEGGKRGLPQLEIRQQALAAEAGRAAFHWIRNADGYSGLQPRDYPSEPDRELIEVETIRLDQLLGGVGRPFRFMKLDLEGGEFRAMQGAGQALAAHRPVIVFENARAGAARAYGYDAETYFGFFDGLGYRLRDLFGRPFTRAEWESPGLPWYFIATARPEDHALLDRAVPEILARVAGAARA